LARCAYLRVSTDRQGKSGLGLEAASVGRAWRRRWARDVHFISGLMSQKIPFIVVDLGPNVDPFMLHIYAALAEKERGMIAERTRAALGAAKQRGVRLGNPRLGEARLVRSARRVSYFLAHGSEIRAAIEAGLGRGATSRDGLARALNERGVASPEGKAWYKTTVQAYLLQSSALDLDEEAVWRQEVFRRVAPKSSKRGG
jgi:hypothetical protein